MSSKISQPLYEITLWIQLFGCDDSRGEKGQKPPEHTRTEAK